MEGERWGKSPGGPGSEQASLSLITYALAESLLIALPHCDLAALEACDTEGAMLLRSVARWVAQDRSVVAVPKLLARVHQLPLGRGKAVSHGEA